MTNHPNRKKLASKHAFKIGDRVAIFNSTLSGRPIFEGYAVVKKLLDTDEYYRVSFAPAYAGAYDRFVDPDAQADPQAFLAKLEAEFAAAYAD